MRNCYFFFCVLFLKEGVFGLENYNMMGGDYVTLNPGGTKIPEDDTAEWWFGEKRIAHMNKGADIFSTSEGDNAGFKDRLKLDNQTGSLTITHIRTTDSGNYKLIIKSTIEAFEIFKVTVRDDVKQLLVMERDQVTLDTNLTKIQRDDQIKWKFGDQVIPTGHLNSAADSRWSNIHLNYETGDLIISNIQKNQSGSYEVEIKNGENILILHRKFRITLEMKEMPVKEGDPVSLQLDTEIQSDELIRWMFGTERTCIAEINKTVNTPSLHEDVLGGIFRGRLKLDRQTGSLTITDTRTEHTGLYTVELTSNSKGSKYIRFIVTLSTQDTTDRKTLIGIIVFLLLLLLLVVGAIAGFVIYRKKCTQPGSYCATAAE